MERTLRQAVRTVKQQRRALAEENSERVNAATTKGK